METSKEAKAFEALLLATEARKIIYLPDVDDTLAARPRRYHNQQCVAFSDYDTVGEGLEELRSALVRRSELEAAKALKQEQEEEQKLGPAKRDKDPSGKKRKADLARLRQDEERADKRARQE